MDIEIVNILKKYGCAYMEHHCENEYLNQDEFCRFDKQCNDCILLEEKQ